MSDHSLDTIAAWLLSHTVAIAKEMNMEQPVMTDLGRNIDRLIAEKNALRDALKFAIEIIGHPDNDGTRYLQKVLADTEPQTLTKQFNDTEASRG